MHRGGSVLFLTGETRISLQDSPVIPVKAAESESKVSNCTQRRDKNSAVVQHWIANSLQIWGFGSVLEQTANVGTHSGQGAADVKFISCKSLGCFFSSFRGKPCCAGRNYFFWFDKLSFDVFWVFLSTSTLFICVWQPTLISISEDHQLKDSNRHTSTFQKSWSHDFKDLNIIFKIRHSEFTNFHTDFMDCMGTLKY